MVSSQVEKNDKLLLKLWRALRYDGTKNYIYMKIVSLTTIFFEKTLFLNFYFFFVKPRTLQEVMQVVEHVHQVKSIFAVDIHLFKEHTKYYARERSRKP